MTLDPIVSLSVALAEAPGTCAFFLGSGVSRDAGVPTGWEVMRDGLRRLHQLETTSAEPLEDHELDAWLVETGRDSITYSELLELIAPDQAVRREYLAGLFEQREPGPTHQALARLGERGLVRVFVTTNFDRLLEHALLASGIEPVVIAGDADLEAAMPREHATCIVVKPHGDYLRATIRNTPDELARLEPKITAELGEIFDRYGIVVLGYSGQDEGISNALRARRSRFGVWWLARGELEQPAAELVEALGGRVVIRDGAAEFLADLERRLAVFEEHPSGMTPAAAHDGSLAMLRAGDAIGLSETLRRERHEYETAMQAITADALASYGVATKEALTAVWGSLRPILERRLATLLPLALYDDDRFASEVDHLARALERAPRLGGLTMWIELAEWSVTWLGYVCGALLVRLDHVEAMRPLLRATWTDVNGHEEPLVWLPGETGHQFGTLVTPESGRRWLAPGWEFLARSLESFDWLRERYPELFADREPRASMAMFDVVMCIRYGAMGHRAAAFFALGGEASVDYARRLHGDARLRERVAEITGVPADDFTQQGANALRNAKDFTGGFTMHDEVAAALETGHR